MFTDASFTNLPDGVSISGQCNLISWSSTKIKRVIKSTLTAEAHALEEGIDAAVCMTNKSRGKRKVYYFSDGEKTLCRNWSNTTID